MTLADEAAAARTPRGSDLKVGVDAISYNQKITFTRYVRMVLPLDGYVFWVRGDLVTPSQEKTINVRGSLHYSTVTQQNETENYAVNTVLFTSEDAVDDLNSIDPDTLYIGNFDGIDFAFSARRAFYKQSNLWHYQGNAIYSDMRTQIIDDVTQLWALTLIISNSLPIWLGLNAFQPAWPFYPPPPPAFELYPSFLAPDNFEPPYATVHIGDDDTRSLVATAGFGLDSSQSQIAADKVRITIWGASNDQAMDFLAMVNQFSRDTGFIGIMNVPVVKDVKRTQNELGTLAQKKVIDFEVSYIQGRVAAISRQLIISSIPNFLPAGYPFNTGRAADAIANFASAATGT